MSKIICPNCQESKYIYVEKREEIHSSRETWANPWRAVCRNCDSTGPRLNSKEKALAARTIPEEPKEEELEKCPLCKATARKVGYRIQCGAYGCFLSTAEFGGEDCLPERWNALCRKIKEKMK